jgi:hypothetical protein
MACFIFVFSFLIGIHWYWWPKLHGSGLSIYGEMAKENQENADLSALYKKLGAEMDDEIEWMHTNLTYSRQLQAKMNESADLQEKDADDHIKIYGESQSD